MLPLALRLALSPNTVDHGSPKCFSGTQTSVLKHSVEFSCVLLVKGLFRRGVRSFFQSLGYENPPLSLLLEQNCTQGGRVLATSNQESMYGN